MPGFPEGDEPHSSAATASSAAESSRARVAPDASVPHPFAALAAGRAAPGSRAKQLPPAGTQPLGQFPPPPPFEAAARRRGINCDVGAAGSASCESCSGDGGGGGAAICSCRGRESASALVAAYSPVASASLRYASLHRASGRHRESPLQLRTKEAEEVARARGGCVRVAASMSVRIGGVAAPAAGRASVPCSNPISRKECVAYGSRPST